MIGSIFEERFQIEVLLGQGGMATVYRATHLQLQKPVALKILLGSVMQDPKLRQGFLREIKAASSLDHPNIVRTLASGITEDGRGYVAMDFLEGESLSQLLEREGKLPAQRARPLLEQIASALAYAHEHGIMHRDIKPSNVIVQKDANGNEHPIIVDFGLAKEVTQVPGGGQGQTATAMQGSPLYMSPEQCQEQRTDPRTDIYSFGCLMHEVLTGAPPFNGESAYSVMYSHIQEEPPSIDPGLAVPASMQVVMERCLQKSPADRYENGAELLAGLNEEAPAAVPGRKRRKKTRRYGRLAAISLATIFGGMVLASVAAFTLGNPEALYCEARAFMLFPDGPPDPSIKNVPADVQKKALEYLQLKLQAVRKKVEANPGAHEDEARSFAHWVVVYLRGRPPGFYFDPVIFDQMTEESYQALILIPNLRTRVNTETLTDLVETEQRCCVRGVWGNPRTIPLLYRAITLGETTLPMMRRDDALTAIATNHWLSLSHLGLILSDPQHRDQHIAAAKKFGQVEIDRRTEERENGMFLAGCIAQIAAAQYAQGDEAAALESLKKGALWDRAVPHKGKDEVGYYHRLARDCFSLVNGLPFAMRHLHELGVPS